MQTSTINDLEHFALDGPITLPIAVAIAVALLLMFAWTLHREQHVVGKRNALLFWVLRAAALGVAMWMLLAPTTVLVRRSTRQKSVAFVTDISRSMATVDPGGTSDDLRWALATGGIFDSTLAAADRALAAAGIAERHLRAGTRALQEHRAESAVLNATAAAREAIEHVREAVGQVVEQRHRWDTASGTTTGELSIGERILEMVNGPDFQSFEDLCRALERGRTPSQKGWRESLPDLEHRMAGIRRRLVELTRKVAEGERRLLQQEHSELLASTAQESRLSRVGGLVASLHDTVFAGRRDEVNLRYSAFDSTLTMLPNQGAPASDIRSYARKPHEFDDPAGMTTNLAALLEELHREHQQQPYAAVFVSTDVIHNDPHNTDPREVAAALTDLPVYVLPIGNTRHVRDIVLHSVLAPSIAMRNDDVVIEASLQAYDCAGDTCLVELMQDGEVIEGQAVDFDSEVATRTVRFEKRMADIGVHQYQVSVVPLDGELTEENNFDHFDVNVTRSEIKVLLADEMPRWEYRYLSQLFRRAPKLECDELLFRPRMIATGRREETKSFPTTVEEWDQYDVVILGDLATEHLPVVAQESLIEYLRERGGTLILIAGYEFMPHAYVHHPLEEILPVKAVGTSETPVDGFAFYLTELGREHHALTIAESAEATRLAWEFVNKNAPLTSLPAYRRPLPTARTLIGAIPRASDDEEAAAAESAFLCWQPIKRGRIVYLSGGETYRLRFLRGDRLHYPLWGQMLRWAIASDLAAGSTRVRIRTDKSRYTPSETIQVLVRLADREGLPILDGAAEAIATRSDDQRFAIPLIADEEVPGQYRGELHTPQPGVYRIEPRGSVVEGPMDDQTRDAASASFTVRADLPQELLDTRCDLALAKQIADSTGGQVLPPTAVGEVVSLTNLEPEVAEEVKSQPLWVQWKFLWVVFACLQTEWIIRKWKGLS